MLETPLSLRTKLFQWEQQEPEHCCSSLPTAFPAFKAGDLITMNVLGTLGKNFIGL